MRLVWTRPALTHLEVLGDYIAQHDPTAAARVTARIETAVRRIRRFPKMGRAGREPDTREWSVPSTPYIVIYRAAQNALEILAIIHGARDRPPLD